MAGMSDKASDTVELAKIDLVNRLWHDASDEVKASLMRDAFEAAAGGFDSWDFKDMLCRAIYQCAVDSMQDAVKAQAAEVLRRFDEQKMLGAVFSDTVRQAERWLREEAEKLVGEKMRSALVEWARVQDRKRRGL